ncbi:peptide synthetase [Streptomyces zagrosensis]|uniref:Peptide synthetase n=1 Tax=Streptomyces zagrosensis TaxID=1042984 RepID=A0A7W9QJR8_9ACTN|nr:peptide synthetase [Streptomyces zagrosensis]MBB5940282.1 hypothetical protein [Streptomyces zagrosensis]
MPSAIEVPELAAAGDAHSMVKEFAANKAFRAAERYELTTQDNPYRRPVRPDDLDWLDYSKPMPVENALKLSALLGHRMLRNAYDSELLYLPPTDVDTAASDGAHFYSARNRAYAALARPILERHLFTLLDEVREPLETVELGALKRHVRERYQQRIAAPGHAFDTAWSARGCKEAGTFLLVQLTAFLPSSNAAAAHNALGEYGTAHPTMRRHLVEAYGQWVHLSDAYEKLLAGAGLVATEGAYWQLCLGTSLARANYLHFTSRNHERLFAFIGALLHKKIDEEAMRIPLSSVLAHTLDADTKFFDAQKTLTESDLVQLVEDLVGPLLQRFGRRVIEGVHAGFRDAVWFADLWDRDVTEQLTWADNIEQYQEKAAKLDHHITSEGIEVDLDTFVESSDETSTTHVHDEHRLVMIESGQMHFWNNVTHKIALNEGDKVLIPMSRLHGSTVLSGECTYHQPIIPEDMLRKFS